MSELCESCGRDWTDHLGIIPTCAENARLKTELVEARRVVRNLANHSHSFTALKTQARDFLAKHPEEP